MPPIPPVVLTLAGHDPCGGAGIQADIEAISAGGGHAASVVTALTVQDTHRVHRVQPVEAALVIEQAETVLADLPVAAIKIGLLGSAANALAIAALLDHHPDIPVVLDPVLAAGGGGAEAGAVLLEAMVSALLPRVHLLTPNGIEAARLAPLAGTPADRAQALIAAGCGAVLITGGHEPGDAAINRLYTSDGQIAEHQWPRLDGEFHGSGCTLAAAVAVRLAHGLPLPQAVAEAGDYTWQALQAAYAVGAGQRIPGRVPRAQAHD